MKYQLEFTIPNNEFVEVFDLITPMAERAGILVTYHNLALHWVSDYFGGWFDEHDISINHHCLSVYSDSAIGNLSCGSTVVVVFGFYEEQKEEVMKMKLTFPNARIVDEEDVDYILDL